MDKFQEITQKMHDTYLAKNADYGNSFHILYNRYGYTYALAHMMEKIERIDAIVKHGNNQVKEESIKDSLLDLANYAILTLMELED